MKAPSDRPSLGRLLLWPTLLTLGISTARLITEVLGMVTTRSGGALHPLGITWLVFATGAFLGWRLSGDGSGPRLRPGWSALLAGGGLAAVIAAVMAKFGPLIGKSPEDVLFGDVRAAVMFIIAVTAFMTVIGLIVWTRIAIALLLYAIPARLTVLAFTWLAKVMGWDTHYTKFGPPGIELDSVAETLVSASIAQLGFWVPFTMVGGTFAGCVAASLRRNQAA
ncbi:MAG: hypothetical protein NXI31_22010 [bacterium]|nr:hypothetical protein [bacterium]